MNHLLLLAFDTRRLCVWLALGWLVVAAAGCRDSAAIQPDDIRVYTAPSSHKPSADRPRPSAEAGLTVSYDLPSGWTDRGASGMRLATLVIDADGISHEVTIIPAAGTLEANVARWLGQLDPAATPEVLVKQAMDAVESARKVPVGSAEATLVTLGDRDADDAQIILAAAIPLDATASLFVTFKGPAAIARREQDAFEKFVSSIRWNEEGAP
jgi:hypothetical protein